MPVADGLEARLEGRSWRFALQNPAWAGHSSSGPADGTVLAPMPGKVISLHVKPGDQVAAGDRLLVLEAMKMEHRLTAPFEARVAEVTVAAGDQVAEGARLVQLERIEALAGS